MRDETRKVATTYFDSWRARDFDRLRSVLADDVDFEGPLEHDHDAESYRRSMEGLSENVSDVLVTRMFVDGADVVTWLDVRPKGVAEATQAANWCHVENGKITRARMTFDPRALLAAS
jgi:ketosteroid isomerase-like protein